MRRDRWLAPALTALIAGGAGLAVAGLAYQLAEGSHGGEAPTTLAVTADALGVLVTLILAAQLFAAYRLFPARARAQMRAHRLLAWAVLGVAALHATLATAHAIQPPREQLPLALAALGVPVALGMVAQAGSGWMGAHGRREARTLHRRLVLFAMLLIVAHVALGILHAVIG